MKPVSPPPEENLPDNVRVVTLEAPEELKEICKDLEGMAHLVEYEDEEAGEKKVGIGAFEFMFELSEEELQVLRYRPFVSLVIHGGQVPPFALSTSFDEIPEDENKTIEHHHKCPLCGKWWGPCSDVWHDHRRDRKLSCEKCSGLTMLPGKMSGEKVLGNNEQPPVE